MPTYGEVVKIYTRKGDDGTTGLFHGGRVSKDAAEPRAYGAVDEAQAALGLARSEAVAGSELDSMLISLERDLYVVMTELATSADNRSKLSPGSHLVTAEMVSSLEPMIDEIMSRFDMPQEFVVPGGSRVSALLDVARTVVRRAERESLAVAADGSYVVAYLNRLSDLVWAMARWQEETHLLARDV